MAGSASPPSPHDPTGATNLASSAASARGSEVSEWRRRAGRGSCPFFCKRKHRLRPVAASKKCLLQNHSTPSLSRLASFSQAHFLPSFDAQTTSQETNYPSQRTRANDGAVRGVFYGVDAAIIFSRLEDLDRPQANCFLAPSKNALSRARATSALFPCKTALLS